MIHLPCNQRDYDINLLLKRSKWPLFQMNARSDTSSTRPPPSVQHLSPTSYLHRHNPHFSSNPTAHNLPLQNKHNPRNPKKSHSTPHRASPTPRTTFPFLCPLPTAPPAITISPSPALHSHLPNFSSPGCWSAEDSIADWEICDLFPRNTGLAVRVRRDAHWRRGFGKGVSQWDHSVCGYCGCR